MRRAVLRIGESLAAREVIPEPGRATGAVRVIRGPRNSTPFSRERSSLPYAVGRR
jgi:hypothetical protein